MRFHDDASADADFNGLSLCGTRARNLASANCRRRRCRRVPYRISDFMMMMMTSLVLAAPRRVDYYDVYNAAAPRYR